MKAKVIQFRRGKKRITPRHFILEVEGSTSKESASKYVGNNIVWTSPGKNAKKISGKIASSHGNKGLIRAIFEKGLPGQAIGTYAELESSDNKKTKTTKSKDELN